MTPEQQQAFAEYAASFTPRKKGRGTDPRGRPKKAARNAAVLKMVSASGMTYRQIGKHFGMSKSAVQGVVFRAGMGRS